MGMSIFPPQGQFGGSKPGSLVVSYPMVLYGSNVYTEVYITNNATLTLAQGASLVASNIIIDNGATLELQGASVIVDNLINEGSINSNSTSDQITINLRSRLGGVIVITGTLTLQRYYGNINHIIFGSISGSGSLEINGIASVEGDSSISVASITGSGTLEIASGVTLTINDNTA